MSIRDKLETLAENALDSLRTTEVQLPLFGLLWIALNAALPAYIPDRVEITLVTQLLPEAIRGAFPEAISPGWLIICLPIIFLAKSLTPGRVAFSTANTKTVKADPTETVVTTVETVTVDSKTEKKEV